MTTLTFLSEGHHHHSPGLRRSRYPGIKEHVSKYPEGVPHDSPHDDPFQGIVMPASDPLGSRAYTATQGFVDDALRARALGRGTQNYRVHAQ
jgi:hypothetical protein